MGDVKSLAHTKWNCKYHIVFVPRYHAGVLWRKEASSRGNSA